MYRGQEDRVREAAGFVLDTQGLGGQGGCPAGTADTDLRLSGRRVLIETRGRRMDVGGHLLSEAGEKNLTSQRARNWSCW